MKSQTMLLLIILSLFPGCVTGRSITKHLDGRTEMQDVVLSRIPTLTTQETAIEFLRAEGFECKHVRDGAFDDRIGMVANDYDPLTYSGGVIGDTRTPRTFKNRNFILGSRTDDGPWPASEIWAIAVTLDSNGVPDDVFVYTRYVK